MAASVSQLRVSSSTTVQRKFLSTSPEQTKRIGAQLGASLKPGDVVVFLANLGAGKTTFVQGLIKSLGVKDEALSPTFITAQTLHGRVRVHHLDFYRHTAKELLDMGLQDYVTGSGEIGSGVVLIEWAERCRNLWPKERMEVHIRAMKKPGQRAITIKTVGPRFQSILNKWKEKS